MSRKVSEIAKEIRSDWKPVHDWAVPYLEAMDVIEDVTDRYYEDSASSVIRYFLGNARTWKGDVARRVKKELNELIEGVY